MYTPQGGGDERMEVKDILKLIVSVFITHLAGQIGALATTASVQTWYVTLNKPIFTPPNWLFAPVWITLYTLMGLSLFLIWRLGVQARGVKLALALFGVQLLLNTLWSIAFFGLRSPLTGLVVIILLWIAIVATTVQFLPLSRPAGLLLIPYLLWVSLAAALNAAILLLN
jgi:benzodiazapine receptor